VAPGSRGATGCVPAGGSGGRGQRRLTAKAGNHGGGEGGGGCQQPRRLPHPRAGGAPALSVLSCRLRVWVLKFCSKTEDPGRCQLSCIVCPAGVESVCPFFLGGGGCFGRKGICLFIGLWGFKMFGVLSGPGRVEAVINHFLLIWEHVGIFFNFLFFIFLGVGGHWSRYLAASLHRHSGFAP
jgi:hypothetical protein